MKKPKPTPAPDDQHQEKLEDYPLYYERLNDPMVIPSTPLWDLTAGEDSTSDDSPYGEDVGLEGYKSWRGRS